MTACLMLLYAAGSYDCFLAPFLNSIAFVGDLPVPRTIDRAASVHMTGARPTAAALGVARLPTAALPCLRVVRFADLGQMEPVTHPGVVNAVIERFLVEAVAGAARKPPPAGG
jgi:hypothetical protein